jgi:hypothetical protein
MSGAPTPPRFQSGNSEPVLAGDWNRKLLSPAGEKRIWVGNIRRATFFNDPRTDLSGIGYELFTLAGCVVKSDPIYPMAVKALTDACGLSYSAAIDVLEEDGFWPVPGAEADWVPSRFAALLLGEGLTGREIDFVMSDWAAKRNPRDRMEKAIQQGVIVSDTTFTAGVGGAVQNQYAVKSVRLRPRKRIYV